MKKKSIVISAVAGVMILALCVKFTAGGGNEGKTEIESVPIEEGVVSGGSKESCGQGKTDLEVPTEAPPEEKPEGAEPGEGQKPEKQEEIAVFEKVLLEKPAAELNGKEGELRYDWSNNVIRVDEETLLFAVDCYFSEERLQQRIIYLAKAPDFAPQEVFRQDSGVLEEGASGSPELLERRMPCPKPVEGGYVFEADASKMLACTDEGLYEYNLENNGRKLLEPAIFTPYEIVHEEGDCTCGETGFEFEGPVEAEYVPGGQGYVFVTGIEYGNPVGVTLRSAEGRTLYQKEIKEYVGGFRWIESEDAVYLAVFYREGGRAWMERVDAYTGEKEVLAVPDEVFLGGDLYVGFLDADHLIYYSEQVLELWESDYKIYRLSDEEIKEPENTGDRNGKLIVLNLGGYRKIIVKCPVFLSSIYESFLNGEITAERKEQQVFIDELFWDNDIEYCFLDIDGDGGEELQIRDGTVYYVVKAQDEADMGLNAWNLFE